VDPREQRWGPAYFWANWLTGTSVHRAMQSATVTFTRRRTSQCTKEPTLAALERQRNLLSAAEALEKRAISIHEWPFAERTPTLVITVVTSVIAMTIGRLILDPFGL